MSFFLWSCIPGEALLDAAERGTLDDPAVLEQPIRRMIADPRSEALVDNFVGSWLAVRNVRDVAPDSGLFPEFDENLREAFQREIARFMERMLREDRSLVDLLDADYPFVNERLARHDGIPTVYGNHFRRVRLPNEQRGGSLEHGSVLTVTSPIAPLRGKWLLDNFFGTLPPSPNIPALEEDNATRTPTDPVARLARIKNVHLWRQQMANTENWMRDLYTASPNTLLKDIIIPGTHDSGTYKGFIPGSKCQDGKFENQLKSGIRYIDLRVDQAGRWGILGVGCKDHEVIIVHGSDCKDRTSNTATLKDVLNVIKDFAAAHPKEILFVDMHRAATHEKYFLRVSNKREWIHDFLGDYLIRPTLGTPATLTFEKIWDDQKKGGHGRNIIFLIKEYDRVHTDYKKYYWDKKIGDKKGNVLGGANPYWVEAYADSISENKIRNDMKAALGTRNSPNNRDKWAKIELTATPNNLSEILLGIRKLTGSGYADLFANSGKYLETWVSEGLKPNFVTVDYYQHHDLVATALKINRKNTTTERVIRNKDGSYLGFLAGNTPEVWATTRA